MVSNDRAEVRSQIAEDEINGFRITIPSQKKWSLVAFLSLWLCGWAVGEAMALAWIVGIPVVLLAVSLGWFPVPPHVVDQLTARALAQGAGGAIFLLVWFVFWTYAGISMLRALMWHLSGREIIIVQDEALELRRESRWWRQAEWFDLKGVRNLRFAPVVVNPYAWSFRKSREAQLQMLGIGAGVAFDHDDQTHRFGIDLEETEARLCLPPIRVQS